MAESPDPAPSRHRLDVAGVRSGLAALPAWQGDASTIVRKVDAPTFAAGIRLVDAVAEAAETMDHHPDIDIRWRHLRFALSTHTAGGVTETDLVFAAVIEALIAKLTRAS